MYPVGIHFFIAQVLGGLFLLYLMKSSGEGIQAYYDNAVWLTGVSGILAAIPMVFLYRRDSARRREAGLVSGREKGRLSFGESLWMLAIGAALAMFVNFLMIFVMLFVESDYSETMALLEEGKGMATLIFWMGIVAPAAEEMIFRWVVYLRLRDQTGRFLAAAISAVIFGIYHGNVVQAIYASILGFAFAWLLESTGSLSSCVLLHMGANVWSLLYPEIVLWMTETSHEGLLLPMLGILGFLLFTGFYHFLKPGRRVKERCV